MMITTAVICDFRLTLLYNKTVKKPIHEIFNRIMSSAEGAIEQPENGEIKTVVVTKGELENELHS